VEPVAITQKGADHAADPTWRIFLKELTHLPLMSRFAILMLFILVVPLLCRRIRLPGVVGLLACGILFGPSGLDVVKAKARTVHDLSDIGKLLLMFFAGMEIDLVQFQRVRRKSMEFEVLTFALPLLGRRHNRAFPGR
jgi:Kef-type K+ transport system membrane component KefB